MLTINSYYFYIALTINIDIYLINDIIRYIHICLSLKALFIIIDKPTLIY